MDYFKIQFQIPINFKYVFEMNAKSIKNKDENVHQIRQGKSSGMSENYLGIITENYQWELSSENYNLVYNITWKS